MPSNPKPRGPRALQLINLLFLLLVVALLVWGLAHRSSSPDVLGRYSSAYAAFLVALALLALLQLLVLCCAGERLRGWAANGYTLVISTLLAVGLTEVLLRVVNPGGMVFFHPLPYHMQGMIDDPQLGYVHPRGVSYQLGENRVSLNAHGLRSAEIPYAKPAGQRRVLALGDSVTFGWGVDQGENFSDRMGPLLGPRWTIVNGGINGYNTEQEQIWLETEGLRYQPDIVVLVYVVNDTEPVFDPNLTTWRRYPEWPPSLPEALNRLRQLSFLFQGTNMFARLRPAASGGGSASSITDQPRWPESKQALVDIAGLLAARGIPFLVARSSGSDPRFFAQLEQAGIAAISLQPAWARVSREQAHVSRVDPHPSAPVHAEMAAELVDEFGRRGWLKDQPSVVTAVATPVATKELQP